VGVILHGRPAGFDPQGIWSDGAAAIDLLGLRRLRDEVELVRFPERQLHPLHLEQAAIDEVRRRGIEEGDIEAVVAEVALIDYAVGAGVLEELGEDLGGG
jgi:hypothetical protein